MNYITGEKLQELAEHTIVFHGQKWEELATEQLKNTNCRYTYFNKNKIPTALPDEVKSAKSLFVYTHALDLFFDKIYPLLQNPFVLITHNSDDCITSKYEQYLNENKIKRWFAQNVYHKHEKLIPIPIGLANSQWPHGNLKLFDEVRRENNKKEILVYKNFDPNTSHCNRLHVLRDTQHIPMSPRKSIVEYWRDISKSMFCICPMGSGVDSHRMWESLYLGAIPIVAECDHNNGFRELPLIMIPDGQHGNWGIVTESFLREALISLKRSSISFNTNKLDLFYWRQLINEFCNL